VFFCLLINNRINTRRPLQRKIFGLDSYDSKQRIRHKIEIVDHLFLWCSFARRRWLQIGVSYSRHVLATHAIISIRTKLGVSFVMDICRRFDPGGSLDRRVKLSPRVPAQMGWREMEHKGENVARVILRQGDALAVGVTSVREGERASLFVSPSSHATLPHEALDLPFIDARRGSRCTMGV
jgi:hypothetical protein